LGKPLFASNGHAIPALKAAFWGLSWHRIARFGTHQPPLVVPRTQGHASWLHLHDNVTGKATATPPLILCMRLLYALSNLPLHLSFISWIISILYCLMLDKTMMMPPSTILLPPAGERIIINPKKKHTQSAHGWIARRPSIRCIKYRSSRVFALPVHAFWLRVIDRTWVYMVRVSMNRGTRATRVHDDCC
jgi:hypothetical protein